MAQLGRIVIISIGLKATWEILQSAEWTEHDLVRIKVAWERVSPLQALEAAMEGGLADANEMESQLKKVMIMRSLRDHVARFVVRLNAADDNLFLLRYHLEVAPN